MTFSVIYNTEFLAYADDMCLFFVDFDPNNRIIHANSLGTIILTKYMRNLRKLMV